MGHHPWRPGHIHFMISKDGYQSLISQIYDADTKYLDNNSVFAVKESLIGKFNKAPAGVRNRSRDGFRFQAQAGSRKEADRRRVSRHALPGSDWRGRVHLQPRLRGTMTPSRDRNRQTPKGRRAPPEGDRRSVNHSAPSWTPRPSADTGFRTPEITHQDYVLVRVHLTMASSAIGEASTLGGPRWAEESVESIQAASTDYLAPALSGRVRPWHSRPTRYGWARRPPAISRRRSAIESAVLDAVGKTLGLPASALLGGRCASAWQ